MKSTWQKIKTALSKELSPHRMAKSFALAFYVAFSPLIGLHTVMIIFFCWLWSLNIALVLALSTLVHNPWTTLPIYYFDYIIGMYCVPYLPFVPTKNPFWMQRLIDYLGKYIVVPNLSLWTFLIGGNIVALIIGIGTYPIVYYIMRIWYTTSKSTDTI